MKKLALIGIATLALGAAAFAQSLVAIDDSLSTGGVQDPSGTYYSGPFGLEVWDLQAAAVPAGINGAATPVAAYAALTTAGFKNETSTLSPTANTGTMSSGSFSLGTATLTAPTPAGSSVVLALAVWNNSSTSWAAMVSGATLTTHAGVLAFLNPTVALPGSGPPPTPASLSGFTDNLVMTAVGVPEPGTLALAGLGLASLLIFRRRK